MVPAAQACARDAEDIVGDSDAGPGRLHIDVNAVDEDSVIECALDAQ